MTCKNGDKLNTSACKMTENDLGKDPTFFKKLYPFYSLKKKI